MNALPAPTHRPLTPCNTLIRVHQIYQLAGLLPVGGTTISELPPHSPPWGLLPVDGQPSMNSPPTPSRRLLTPCNPTLTLIRVHERYRLMGLLPRDGQPSMNFPLPTLETVAPWRSAVNESMNSLPTPSHRLFTPCIPTLTLIRVHRRCRTTGLLPFDGQPSIYSSPWGLLPLAGQPRVNSTHQPIAYLHPVSRRLRSRPFASKMSVDETLAR